MTNEEKARELQLDYISNGCGDSTDIRCACEEMAEWKDQQFKEYLEKKKTDIKIELRKNISDVVSRSFSNIELALIYEIIVELFPNN